MEAASALGRKIYNTEGETRHLSGSWKKFLIKTDSLQLY